MRLLSSASILVLALAACSSGGGGATGNAGINPGTTSTSRSATGLPFADDVVGEPSVEGPLTITVARFQTDYSTGQTRIIVSKENLNITDVDSLEGTLTLGGSTLNFVYDSFRDETYAIWNGQAVEPYLSNEETYVSAVAFYTYDDSKTGFDTEAVTLIGFETNPANLPSGFTTYSASGDGYGNFLEAGSVTEQEVQFYIDAFLDVDFDSLQVDGDIYLELDTAGESRIADLRMVSTDLQGNGFDTTAVCLNGCSGSSSLVGGAFYGPNAEEIAGLLALDISDGTKRFVGAGAFLGSAAAGN